MLLWGALLYPDIMCLQEHWLFKNSCFTNAVISQISNLILGLTPIQWGPTYLWVQHLWIWPSVGSNLCWMASCALLEETGSEFWLHPGSVLRRGEVTSCLPGLPKASWILLWKLLFFISLFKSFRRLRQPSEVKEQAVAGTSGFSGPEIQLLAEIVIYRGPETDSPWILRAHCKSFLVKKKNLHANKISISAQPLISVFHS